ncbi:hypothetical protein GWI33_012271 [Rhynchophorus ferrugineus]|uniref:Uncharacterized protein n=1 Tax=Rhynchophorus ferrugineus TaxID=354439 RepID=A0A834I5N1_RHYFE|nr:hypothetical protein GWI33_012271 [Rhynchophorus ferrugineus]
MLYRMELCNLMCLKQNITATRTRGSFEIAPAAFLRAPANKANANNKNDIPPRYKRYAVAKPLRLTPEQHILGNGYGADLNFKFDGCRT